MASSAVQIEVVNKMNENSFIQSLRWLIAQRGTWRCLRSGNSSKFVGAERIFTSVSREGSPTSGKIFRKPPTVTHMVGVWERRIRSARAKSVALNLIHGKSLDDESLITLMFEVKAMMKCRQLTVETISDVNSPMVNSPSNLLTLKFNDSTTQKFEKVDLYDRKWLMDTAYCQ